MCRYKSGLLTKDGVFVPDYDSHTDMLLELGIEDTEANARSKFVRFELYPKDGNVFSDISTWIYRVDQDILPDWYVEEVDKALSRAIAAVKEWAKNRIHIGKENLVIDSGEGHCIKDCKNVTIKGTAEVTKITDSDVKNIYDNAKVGHICGNAKVRCIYGNTKVGNIHGSAEVGHICGNAKVGGICDNAEVKCIYGNAEIGDIYGNVSITSSKFYDWANKAGVKISGNAVFRDCFAKTIYQAGDWKLVNVGESGRIGENS